VQPRSARHHWGPNLALYHYVEKRYGKKARAQVFWLTTGLIVLFVGSLVALQMSETDAERKARAQKQQEEFLVIACKQGKDACDKAQEEIRRQNCELFGEDCSPKVKK
jgi:hypothetical protein